MRSLHCSTCCRCGEPRREHENNPPGIGALMPLTVRGGEACALFLALEDALRLVNCAACGREAIAKSVSRRTRELAEARGYRLREGGRMRGRPYCSLCLRPEAGQITGVAGGAPPRGWDREEGGPWGELANRKREEG